MAYLVTMPSVAKTANWKRLVQSRLVWCVLVVAVAASRFLVTTGSDLFASLGDTDDATRLVQLRLLLDGADWFDMRLVPLGAPESLYSHWSRLIDLPQAMMIGAISVFVDANTAETATRIVWPLLVLLPMVYLVVREADRQAGGWAALIAAVMVLGSPFALYQFMPGRLDHHNVQILCIAGALILLPRAMVLPAQASFVGIMLGIGLLVGFEALVLCVFVLGVAVLFSCFAKDMRAGTTQVMVACALTIAIGFAATTAPDRWFLVVCDAVSVNLIGVFGIGAATLLALWRFAPAAGGLVWLGALSAAGVFGVVVYGALEPACLAGPMGQVDPRVRPIWLDQILEVQSLFEFSKADPKVGFTYLALGLTALAVLGARLRKDFTIQCAFQLVVVLAALGYGLIFVRLVPYAMWIVIPVLAIWMARLPAIGSISATTVRFGTAVLVNPLVLLMIGHMVSTKVLGHSVDKDQVTGAIAGCEQRSGMRLIGKLAPGLVVADIDLGPHIVAHSRHRVLAAPYHRIDKSIVRLNAILTATPKAAEAKLRALDARYVVLCAKPDRQAGGKSNQSFAGVLRRGQPVAYLQPIKLGVDAGALRAWRVLSAGR